MARMASCPQCDHELLVPSEAENESWAKCPGCRAFFQVNQATTREVPTALLVEPHEQPVTDVGSQHDPLKTIMAEDDLDIAAAERSTANDDLDFDNLIDEPKQGIDREAAAAAPDEFEPFITAQKPAELEVAATHGDDLELDDLSDAPKKADDLEAAAQRIDEWFRSAKTVPDASLIGEDDEAPSVEEIPSNLSTAGTIRPEATIDMDATDGDELAAMADFDLDEPDDRTAKQTIADPPAWDDSARMEDLLGDPNAPATVAFGEEFAESDDADGFNPDFAHDEASMDTDRSARGDEQPAVNLLADRDRADATSSKRRGRRRERSLVRSLMLIVVAGLFGSTVGYYALLWLRGPSIDFLNVAQYLPKTVLPASFDEPKAMVRNVPQPNAAEVIADVEPATGEVGTDLSPSNELTEPQELPPAADASAEPISDVTAATETESADMTDQSTEVQASFNETEPPTEDANAAASAVGDRYSTTTGETETGAANESTATGVTSEKPAITDLSVDDLAPANEPATDLAVEPAAAAEPSLPATTEPVAAGETTTDAAGGEPVTLDNTSTDPLFDDTETNDVPAPVEVKIAGAPSFTEKDLQASLDSATKAQPQLVEGNFADSKAVAQVKARSYAVLADLAQKAFFVDASQPSARPMIDQADELLRKTLADAHIRGEVAQILPRWIQSPNRKHGGVFFAGKVVSHTNAGSVVECTVELDGGQSLTVLAPAGAVDSLDPATPLAIVGWIVDAPKTQVSGYTGSATTPAIWTKKVMPLE